MTDSLPGPPPLVACVDSSADVVEFLRDLFVDEGLRAVPYTGSLTEGSEKLIAFLRPLRPDVIVYAVSFPYAENWADFEAVHAALPDHRCVVTTTNKRALEEVVGPTSTLEIIGKPFDLDLIVRAVRRALAAPCSCSRVSAPSR